MRAGGCTVQQALTTEAATVVKQAVILTRRRGHAQVTPLHVANTMLSSSAGLLRTACLQSHSHPLQCKALELCFNVALNRLPASTSNPLLGTHTHQYPSISNALVAAFKRAQAHQRRGSIENQQQPILTVKIELHQLIISILDDPSVSRVMREAGFSSTQVKSNVEQAVSLEICSQNTATTVSNGKSKESNNYVSNDLVPSHTQVGEKPSGRSLKATTTITDSARNEDVKSVIESLMNKRKRSIVIVGECLASVEGVVNGVMDMVVKGDVPEALREVKFIPFPISALGHLSSRVDVDQKLEDIKALVRSYLSKGVVLNLGDLNWVVEYRANSTCLMEHIIVEIGKIARGIRENNGKFWLMGIATSQTYMNCKSGHLSLETVWGLDALTILSTNLSLSLVTDSGVQARPTSGKIGDQNGYGRITNEGEEQKQSKSENEARRLQSSTCKSNSMTTSNLPAWLQQYKNESKGLGSNDQDCVSIKDLCNKRNSISSSIHQKPCSSEKTITFSAVSPSSSTSGFSYDHQYPNSNQTHRRHRDWVMIDSNQSWRDQHFWVGSESVKKNSTCIGNEPSMGMYPRDREPIAPFSSNPNSTPNSTSSSDIMEMEGVHRFKGLNAENLKILCDALEKKVPWQKDIIPDIAATILQCRSGMVRRKGEVTRNSSRNHQAKEETWLFFQGVDMEGKEKIAKELARIVFGSQNNFIPMALSSFSSTRADSTEECRNKRSRDEQSCSYIERFAEAVSSNPRRVFLMEDVEQADYCSQMRFKRAIESGRIANASGEEVNLQDAIIILSCESFSSRSRACSPPVKQKTNDDYRFLDLNISLDDYSGEDQSIDDIGLLESVDRRIVFKIHDF